MDGFETPRAPLGASPTAARLSRAREILAEAGRPDRATLAARGDDAGHPEAPTADQDHPAEAATDEPVQPVAARSTLLALAVLTGAVKPLAKLDVPVPTTLTRLRTSLFPAPAPGEPSRLELTALGAALIGAAFIGTTLPGAQPVQAQQPPTTFIAAAPALAAPAAAASTDDATDASSSDTAATPSDAASSSADAAAAATPPAATPASTADDSADDTSSADQTDGSDPLAGGGGSTLARVALVVVHGDAPARWPSAPAGSAARTRAATGTTFTGFASLPSAPLATGLALIAGQGSNPATRAGCTAPSPVTPGTTDTDGVTAGVGCDYPAETPSLAGAIARDGRTWKAYTSAASPQEAIAKLCRPTDAASPANLLGYAQRSPLGHLGDLASSGACENSTKSISALTDDLAADEPAWVYAEIGDCGTDGCDATETADRDRDLDAVLKALAAEPADGGATATFVVGDGAVDGLDPAPAGSYPANPADPDAPPAVLSGALLIGTDVEAGATDPIALDPFALARTQAAWLGVTPPGLSAADTVSPLTRPGS